MKFNATSRSVQGSSASRRLRRAGRVPAIVYGGQEQPLNIELDHNEIYHALRKEAFHASILDMEFEGKTQSVLLRAVQWHPYKQQVLHIDFQRVSATESITTKVPLHFLNGDNSPAVKLGGAMISQIATELEVTCLPADLPTAIEVDLSKLEAGASVHLADVALPKGVTAVVHGDDNPVLALAVVAGGAKSEETEEDAGE
ncbi:50S ribosomal protein L25/general stress protein Ctc [Pusillimonas sp. CC-YST705]|uniref:Large ribosomal subunit protein bL25 n=1 Tax=Mesopusillimonas faecipullorum TaxID=2755040 RepID=A0ABS8CBS1_9BURK|nr:50S ribosomal protein L25/general stress protein Ctc [Mesopusillimonas faecipullorum]MCB5363477.1 50S ribosomal protein L25/general stress protein Ctc [Mesopusillimonas faecipullorum]